MDVSNFYLNTPLDRPEFMRLPIKIIPKEIIDKYNLNDIVDKGWVYFRIEKVMYGLPMAGKLANNLLIKRMSKHVFPQSWCVLARVVTVFAHSLDE